MGWLTNKLRAGRFSMNLKLSEMDLAKATPQHCAAVLVAAAGMMEKLSTDDFMTGALLSRAVLDPYGTTSDDALNFYNVLEDVLNATEQQRKQGVKHMAALMGSNAANDLDRQLQVQQQGIRLLMVALARKVDASFKPKANILREALYAAKDQIAPAIETCKMQQELTSGLATQSSSANYENIKVKAELFAFAAVGW